MSLVPSTDWFLYVIFRITTLDLSALSAALLFQSTGADPITLDILRKKYLLEEVEK